LPEGDAFHILSPVVFVVPQTIIPPGRVRGPDSHIPDSLGATFELPKKRHYCPGNAAEKVRATGESGRLSAEGLSPSAQAFSPQPPFSLSAAV